MEEKKAKPIHIRSTKEYLVVFVNLELLPRGLFLHSCWVPVLENYLKYWNAMRLRQEMRLIVCWNGTKGGQGSKSRLFQRMQNLGISLGWMVGRFPYLDRQYRSVGISPCPDTYRTGKRRL